MRPSPDTITAVATPRLSEAEPTRLLGPTDDRRTLLGRYRLDRRLGAGGFGVVWQAWDERLERDVAVKVVPRTAHHDERPRRSPAYGRVEQEARAAARLNHPGIVALYELASDEHDVYLVSELVRGRTLAELLAAGAVADRDVARIGVALCDALEHAHRRGVIHRDVKPHNVMVVEGLAEASAGFAKLTDFGVAHVATAECLTATGDVVGTLAYMAPEQAEGGSATPACDTWSLALTLYECWTGSNPLRAASPAATARRLAQPLPSLGDARGDLPPELCDALDEALERDPELRATLGELRTALRTAEPELSEEGGLAEASTLVRVGLARRRGLPAGSPAAVGAMVYGLPGRLAGRALSGAASGALLLVALTQLGPAPPVTPLAAACVVAVTCALLPRVGWLVAAAALCGWLASPEAGRAGTALVVAAALAPVPLLLPRAGPLWPLPAVAPLLGAVALAPAFVALAALASSLRRRAGLAAAGYVQLAVAELVTGDALLFGLPDGASERAAWESSAPQAVNEALYPLVSSPALAPLAVWSAFAVLLAVVVRGRLLVLDLLAALGWTAALAAAFAALGDLLAATTALDHARGMPAAAMAGALAVVALSGARRAGGGLAESAPVGQQLP